MSHGFLWLLSWRRERRTHTQVKKYLSQGNFGVVWLVQDSATSELRVIKLPRRSQDIPLFLEEVELHRGLDSSFIVAFVESFEYHGWPVRPGGRVRVGCSLGSLGVRSRAFTKPTRGGVSFLPRATG